MKHITNFDSFLNEATIMNMELSLESMIEMIKTNKNTLNPGFIVNLLMNKSWILATAVTTNGPREGILLLKNISIAIKKFVKSGPNAIIDMGDGKKAGPFKEDDIKAAFDNLKDIFFGEFYNEFEDRETSEVFKWYQEVTDTSKEKILTKQIDDAKKEILSLQQDIETIKQSIKMMEDELDTLKY